MWEGMPKRFPYSDEPEIAMFKSANRNGWSSPAFCFSSLFSLFSSLSIPNKMNVLRPSYLDHLGNKFFYQLKFHCRRDIKNPSYRKWITTKQKLQIVNCTLNFFPPGVPKLINDQFFVQRLSDPILHPN